MDFQPAHDGQPAWRRRLEIILVMFGLTWAIIYPLMTPFPPVDLQIFLDAGAGRDLNDFFYAPWSLPFFALLDLLPFTLAAVVANFLSWGGFLFALWVFKGSRLLLFISYPFLMLTYYGQVDGIYAFGLAVMYLALKRDNHLLASIGWMIAIVKFYVGGPLGLGLLVYFAADHRARLRVVGLMAVYGLLSLVLWPNWIGDLLARAAAVPPNLAYSIDLWRYTGPAILLLWVPVFLSRRKDFIWWTATWVLTVPYLYVWTLTFLILLPIGPVAWGVQVSFVTGFVLSTFLQVIPLVIYLRCWWQSWRTDRLMDGLRRWRAHQPTPHMSAEPGR
jgi:hypothetical protein